jgi:hypothetical protein
LACGRPNPRALRLVFFALMAAALGCGDDGGDGESGPAPSFPADYASSYSEVRDCRNSGDHELNRVRVLADPSALAPYRERDADFPVGAVVLKAEHGFGDADCTGAPVRWTVMTRLAAGSSPQTLDWYWQDVDASRRVTSENDTRCIGCHTGCGVPPEGYLGTCTVVGLSDGAFP